MKNPSFSLQPRLLVGAITNAGSKYDHNEDCFWLDDRQGLFLLADGIGGRPAGEIASRLAVERMRLFLNNQPPDDAPARLGEALQHAQQEIRREADASRAYRGMGTTALIAWMPPEKCVLWTAHVGNSRAYRFRGGQLQQLTGDHTLLGDVRRAGMLPDDPAMWPPKGMLSQSLGAGQLIAPEVRRHDLQDRDLILLCTDGVSDVLSDAELLAICESAQEPGAICERIKAEVFERGAPDNLTAIAFRTQWRRE